MKRLVKNNVHWVGKVDWELKKFHGDDYSINNGSSQNAYLIQEEKTVLIDTIWLPHAKEFRDNLEKEIDLDAIDFIVINHGEVDHSGALPYLMEKIPNTPIYCTANAVKSLVGQYHHPSGTSRSSRPATRSRSGTARASSSSKCGCSTGPTAWLPI